MRFILLLAVPLAACGSPSSDNEALPEGQVIDISNRTAGTPPGDTALPAPGTPALADDLILTTNEPFWQARIGKDAVVLTGIDQPERRLSIVSNEAASDGRAIRARDARGTVDVTIRNVPCEDDMSGARFPFSGRLQISGLGGANGCARLASAPPPAIPDEPAEVGAAEAGAAAIPARFVGRWAPDRAACRTPASSIEGLTISPRELRFHESLGVPTRVERRDADTVAVTSAYEGEGQQWTATQTLRLAGDRLTVTTRGEAFTRIRCG